MDDSKVIELFKSGLTKTEIARHLHVQNFVIASILRGFPSAKLVKKIKNTPDLEE